MGRRPKIWNIRNYRSRGWLPDKKDITKEYSKLDLERWETLPFKESKNSIYRHWGWMKSPIKRFLMDQLGRDYDEVFSELCQNIPAKYRERVNLHDYKMPSSFHPEVTRWFLDDYYSWRNVEPQHGFYVDLETRTLGFIERVGRKAQQEIEHSKPVYQPFDMDKFKVRYDYGQNFVFQQLLTYEDFEKEAFKMKHCVRSYWYRCTVASNKTSIWSLSNRQDKLLTIELLGNQVVQVKGESNRRPVDFEKKVVEHWVHWTGLTIREGTL